ncbi:MULTISPECIES: ArsR/SmtB family transcription factor [Halorussus]|uniref:ArsR/SmtB family transcription factor n=1 Tax=Halorussus TaxID=1070314 RepID=UPI00209F567C|nr:metalloregulator ArsR/SmtB family transcription factor [Halorussus vallis]USZ77274.1 metalloregulator ArsR/SmtB family transcription factor [Halorussus vallis]
MDSAELLDILGNENRRRILRLLARKPCYVTEISEYLGVSPKAVIDHLRKLEDAGLIESRTDDQRRKYFSISRNLRLEVEVSPYQFGMKSAYPASTNLDVSACRYVSLNIQYDADTADQEKDADEAAAESSAKPDETADEADGRDADETDIGETDADAQTAAGLAAELTQLEDLQSELSLAQRWVHGRIADVRDRLASELDAEGEKRLHAEVLAAVAGGAETVAEVARDVDAPEPVVEECLDLLAGRDVLTEDGGQWSLAE